MSDKPIRLRDFLKEAQLLSTYKTDKLTAKMWVLPNGEVKSLDDWHFRWLQKHPDVASDFGLDMNSLPDEEQTVRLAALNKGFIRINYEINRGALTIESNIKYFSKKIRDILFMLIADNVGSIDNITINLLNDDGKVVKSESNVLFRYDDQEKMNNLPFLSESKSDES